MGMNALAPWLGGMITLLHSLALFYNSISHFLLSIPSPLTPSLLSSAGSRSIPNPSSQDLHNYRVTALLLQVSTHPLLWVGLAAGYLLVIDTTTCLPLMVTHRHMNSIRDIHMMRHLGEKERQRDRVGGGGR